MVILKKRFLKSVTHVIADCGISIPPLRNYDIKRTETEPVLVSTKSRID